MNDQIEMTALVHDRPGVLARIANVFYRRGINIVTLDVGPSRLADHSALTTRVAAGLAEAERVAHALRNLVDVVSVDVAPLAHTPASAEPSALRSEG